MSLKWIWLAIGGLFGVVLVVSNGKDAPAPVDARPLASNVTVDAPVRATSKAAGFQPATAAQAGSVAAPNFTFSVMGKFPIYWFDAVPINNPSYVPGWGLVQIGDVTGDRRLDVVGAHYGGYNRYGDLNVVVYASKGDGSFAAPAFYPQLDQDVYSHMRLGDFNEDGKQDVLLTGGKRFTVFATKQGVGFDRTSHVIYDTVPMMADVPPAVLDVDGDGHLDLVFFVRRADSSGFPTTDTHTRIVVRYGDGRGRFSRTWSAVTYGVDPYDVENAEFVDIGDITGDGIPEVAFRTVQFHYWQQIKTQQIRFFRRDGAGHLAPMLDVPAVMATGGFEYSAMEIFALGDFNGDGRTDIAGAYLSDELWIKLQSPNGQFDTPPLLRQTDQIPVPIVVADVDNSGSDDLVMGHSGWSRITWYLQSNNVLGPMNMRESELGNYPQIGPTAMAVGDVTGDGCMDVAYAQAEAGLVLYRGTGCKRRPLRTACCSSAAPLPAKPTAGAPAVPAKQWMWSTSAGGWVAR